MCYLCDENGGEMLGCPECGRLICFDEEPSDWDVMDRAAVTSSGDLMCLRCARQVEAEEQREDEREAAYEYEEPMP